jgi:MFS family permease
MVSGVNPSKQPIPRMVWTLGVVMLLINLSFVMIYSFSGVYLKTLLGVSTTLIGLLEGVAEASSYLMKLFSGMFSDYLRRRKPVMVFGYMLSVFSRPLLAMAGSFGLVFTARLMERIGNGIQATPRDAIVADVAPPKRIGASYGLKRSLGTMGSFFGAICGFLAMVWTNDNFHYVFYLACIPAFIAFALLLIFVKEPKRFDHPAVSAEAPTPAAKRRHKIQLSNFKLLGQTFWLLMLVNGIFMLARMSETFLILHARENLGLAVRYAPVVMMLFNFGWCISSYPIGAIADRMNRYVILAVGIIFIVLADLTLASATNLTVFFVGVLLWGVQYGITQNIFVSLIAETVPEDLRGTGFGCYYVISATSAFICDVCAGHISDSLGEATAFLMSAVVALFSLLALVIIMGYKRKR